MPNEQKHSFRTEQRAARETFRPPLASRRARFRRAATDLCDWRRWRALYTRRRVLFGVLLAEMLVLGYLIGPQQVDMASLTVPPCTHATPAGHMSPMTLPARPTN